ncbi:MAG: hypothetical protein ACREKH_09255, partial [Candidatus Rokuibacteriota bacterium]
MRHLGAIALSFLLAGGLCAGKTRVATAACVSGEMTAEVAPGPEFAGLYKYTLSVTWDLDQHDLSHLDFFLKLENCECICNQQFIQFGTPAGHSSSGGCDTEYAGEYVCMGDPALPPSFWAPAVKFEPSSGCEPGLQGTGTFCFYSPMPPVQTAPQPDGLVIKHGQDICAGTLVGQVPGCECSLQS